MPALTRVLPVATHRNQRATRPVEFDQAAAFGQFLRTARERRGLSLQQIAQETKIPQRHLISLEHGDLSVIPGRTYRRGEVAAYATAVGLDRAVALAELERVSQPAVSDDAATVKQSKTTSWHLPVGLVAVLAVLSVFALNDGAWKPMFRQAPSPSLTNDSPTPPQSGATAHQQETPTGTTAEAAPASQRVPQSRQSKADVATASSPPDAANQEQVADSAAAGPSSEASIQSGLVIITEPAGARVTVDGIGWGTTPVTIRNLPAGTKQIRVTKDGYAAAVRIARIPEQQQRVTLTIPLQSATSRP